VRQLGDEDLGRIREMSAVDLDALPFGVIRVDKHGVITAYNAFESHAAGREARVVGTRFAELAPCAMVKQFAGVIEQGFVEQRLDRVLRFTFPVREADCIVSVRLFHDAALNQVWTFVTRRRPSEP